jgi:hypothetical protein
LRLKRVELKIGTVAALAAGVIGVAATPALAASKGVAGSLSCVSGSAVTGVFVHANSGGGGWATMSSPGGKSSTLSWTYTIPNTGSYYLAVGCGGTTQTWATTNYSNNYSGNSQGLLCYDTPLAPSYEVPAGLQNRCQ